MWVQLLAVSAGMFVSRHQSGTKFFMREQDPLKFSAYYKFSLAVNVLTSDALRRTLLSRIPPCTSHGGMGSVLHG
jgi:hypothetical protein